MFTCVSRKLILANLGETSRQSQGLGDNPCSRAFEERFIETPHEPNDENLRVQDGFRVDSHLKTIPIDKSF
jgi:hypothetical protein